LFANEKENFVADLFVVCMINKIWITWQILSFFWKTILSFWISRRHFLWKQNLVRIIYYFDMKMIFVDCFKHSNLCIKILKNWLLWA